MDQGSSLKGELIRLAVFGNPVRQSLSPRIHRAFAKQFGLLVDYRAIEADEDTFSQLVHELAAHGGTGCNITVPFKQAAFRLATHHSETAERAQAANTLMFKSTGGWMADNTDGIGLVNDIHSQARDLQGARLALLGAGGASAGVLAALLNAGCLVSIANRTLHRALDLASRHGDLGEVQAIALDDMDNAGPFDLVVNATSMGHGGLAVPVQPEWFVEGGLCYDLNYGKAAAPLARFCSEQGIGYSDGLGMLVGQAAESFRLWTGKVADCAPVLAELRKGLE